MISVCFCEPFLVSGTLPTLGVTTLKSALNEKGISSKIFYPSIELFLKSKIMLTNNFMELVDDIPLQIAEYLFYEGSVEQASKILESHNIANYNIIELEQLRNNAAKIFDDTLEEIIRCNPKVLAYSFTFRCYNFAKKLFTSVKTHIPDIKIVVGGSNCTPDFSRTLINEFDTIDYIICDETPVVFTKLIESILQKKTIDSKYITTHSQTATALKTIGNMDDLPIPDFDDYINIINRHKISSEFITLPYEISRGCWWCQIKPCTMCGFYGNRKNFIIKSPGKVVKELSLLKQKYNVNKFRFSDLVQPKTEYLWQIQELSKYNLKLFWELRPDVTEEDIYLLRNIGVTFTQIGIESFSSEQLLEMNKGTTGIHNIYVLLLCSSYKIKVLWNYLYGFEQDLEKFYTDILHIIPLLYHLPPPILRKVWINKYSQDFDLNNVERIETFSSANSDEMQTFFNRKPVLSLSNVYDDLKKAIQKWYEGYNKNFGIYIDSQNSNYLKITRIFEDTVTYEFFDDAAKIYNFFMQPHTLYDAQNELKMEISTIYEHLQKFMDYKLMLYLDDRYLALTSRNTAFKTLPEKEQPLYLTPNIFEREG